jgi:small-conductance mechanosensitive channel
MRSLYNLLLNDKCAPISAPRCGTIPKVRRHTLFALVTIVSLCAGGAQAADQTNARVSVLSGEQVVQILDETVDWYRTLGTQQQYATEPSDLLILFANRQTADQVVGLAFGLARANAELLSNEASAAQNAAEPSSQQALDRQQNQLQAQQKSIQQEMDAAHKLTVSGKSTPSVDAKLHELQGELDMVNARKNLLDTMTEFVSSSDPKAAGATALKAQIDAIAATIPSANAAGGSGPSASAAAAGQASTAAPSAANPSVKPVPVRSGLWDMTTNVLKQKNKIASIDLVDQHTADLAQVFQKISGPPLKQLNDYAARSDALAAQADHAESGALKELRGQFDTLAWLFKQTSEILIPLSKEQILLQQYRHNLASWRDSSQRQYHEALATLAMRAGTVAGILAAVFVLAEVWRRFVLRYVHDVRRRHQLLLIRSVILWPIVICIVGLSFVTEISSFATFAGLLTAGLAVAMQSLLASVVGYFLLIGKYGIRVGDRIQIGAVVGEVVDLGLVRMHLMELNQQGPLGPTGRVVAFPNLVVFQASGGLFKQIPAGNLAWRETTLTLPVVADYAALKEKLLAAVRSVVPADANEAPQVQMRLVNGRMEALLRYPMPVGQSPEVDERVAQAVLKVMAEAA